jgi:hypothetical protein
MIFLTTSLSTATLPPTDASAGRAGFPIPIALICISLFVSQVTKAFLFLTFSLSLSLPLLQCTPRTSYYRMINYLFCIIAFRKSLITEIFWLPVPFPVKKACVCPPGVKIL